MVLIRAAQITLVALTIGFGVAACTSGFEDPFSSPKTGSVTESRPINLTEFKRGIILLRVGHRSDAMIESNGNRRFQEGQIVSWTHLTVTDQSNGVTTKSRAEILDNSKCAAGYPDVQELLATYKSMVAICDKELIGKLESASYLSVKTEDGEDHLLTSWSVRLRSLGITNAMIYSLSL